MNDIVSMRKMRPWPESGTSCGLGLAIWGCATGSAEVFGEDFFFGGNEKSLAVHRRLRAVVDAGRTTTRLPSKRLRCNHPTSADQPARLTDHLALIADAALAFVCESLHARENRIRI